MKWSFPIHDNSWSNMWSPYSTTISGKIIKIKVSQQNFKCNKIQRVTRNRNHSTQLQKTKQKNLIGVMWQLRESKDREIVGLWEQVGTRY